jgi:hypothetical protein
VQLITTAPFPCLGSLRSRVIGVALLLHYYWIPFRFIQLIGAFLLTDDRTDV